MKQLRWSVASQDDLFRTIDQLAISDPALGDVWLNAILAAPEPLLHHPYLGPEIGYHGSRKWPVCDTRLLLLYSVTADAVRIDRIVDSRSDWQSFL